MNYIFRSKKLYEHFLTNINDVGYKPLLIRTKQTPGFAKRSKDQIVSYYQTARKDGTIEFITPSGTTPGVYYRQRVVLVDLSKIVNKSKDSDGKLLTKPIDIVRGAIKRNLKVTCNDPSGSDEPSWIYWGFKYIATQKKYNAGDPENRAPDIRNPQQKGSLCKHLIQVMKTLPFLTSRITKDLVKVGAFD